MADGTSGSKTIIKDQKKYCSVCDKDQQIEIIKGDKFCATCGYMFSDEIKPNSTSVPPVARKVGGVTASIVVGVILFVAGLIGILMRGEITVKIVGRGQIMKDMFFGGGSTESTLITVMVVSGIAMILGLILFFVGLKK